MFIFKINFKAKISFNWKCEIIAFAVITITAGCFQKINLLFK